METKSFYNSTDESGQYLLELQSNASALEGKVLDIYRQFPTERISASEVYRYLEKRTTEDILLTSVRRAVSTLKKKGLLTKTHHKVKGMYGRPEYCYQLVNE